jgi:GNAT superfamily N-acetyltransferase
VPNEAQDTDWRALAAPNIAASFETIVRRTGRRWAHWDDVWISDHGCAALLPNIAILRRPIETDSAARELIERISRIFAAGSGAKWCLASVWSTPDLTPFGPTHLADLPLMVRLPGEGPSLPATDLRIVDAHDAATVADFESVLFGGFFQGMRTASTGELVDERVLGEELHAWVGYVDDRPVTRSAAQVGPDITGVYYVATLPEYRGRGYGAAMTEVAATADPTLPAVLESSAIGYGVYQRMGFRDVGMCALWGMLGEPEPS